MVILDHESAKSAPAGTANHKMIPTYGGTCTVGTAWVQQLLPLGTGITVPRLPAGIRIATCTAGLPRSSYSCTTAVLVLAPVVG